MKTTNDKIIFEKKTSPLQNYAIVRIYLGMSEYLTLEGKKLTRFEMDQPELCRISVYPLLTEFYNTLNFQGDEVAICTKNEDKELNDNEVSFQSGTQNAKKAVKSAFNKISEFRSIYINYILVNNIYITSSVNNPPSEEARNAQLTQLSHFEPSEPQSAADPFAAAKAPATKPNFGSANDYFHEWTSPKSGKRLYQDPVREVIELRMIKVRDQNLCSPGRAYFVRTDYGTYLEQPSPEACEEWYMEHMVR